jgi:hypothetical protein
VDQERASVLTRSVWTFVWFAIISVGTNAWWSWASWSGFAVVGPLITLVGLVGMVAVWTVPLSHQRLFEHLSFVTSLLAVALTNGSSIATSRFFYTDSAAFNQLATQLLVKGHNPYSATFKPAMLQLNHAADFWTYTLSGGHVDKVSYPAGSFVMQAPFQLLGLHHLGAEWLDLLAWLVAAVILYVVSPWYAKWLSPLLLLTSVFTFTLVHGGTDALFVPFVMLAALRWDDFVTRLGPRWSRWLGPVALGVACSIKQTPWFAVAFFVVGIALEANHRRRRRTRRRTTAACRSSRRCCATRASWRRPLPLSISPSSSGRRASGCTVRSCRSPSRSCPTARGSSRSPPTDWCASFTRCTFRSLAPS